LVADFSVRPVWARCHLALTAAATWFVAGVKLEWREACPRDPDLARQFELEVLPALSLFSQLL
jgi:hypothetical protein